MSNAAAQEVIERAYRHVATGWLPPQPAVLEKITNKLKRGEYSSNRRELAEDLKSDVSLYLYCVRELATLVQIEEQRTSGRKDVAAAKHTPPQLIERATDDQLKEIFQKSEKEISLHTLDEMSRQQVLRFREALVTASAAELLAEKSDLDPEIGFSCGMIRQLGLTLIAWNYPRVFSRAVEGLKPHENLDAVLHRALGFSPSLLGLMFARQWNLSDEILIGLGDRQLAAKLRNSASKPGRDAGGMLMKICEVGEALARANNPEQYPSALHDWEMAQEAIAEHLGPKGVELILAKAEQHSADYAKTIPDIPPLVAGDALKDRIIDSRFATTRLEKNPYLRGCPQHLRELITRLYHQLKPNKILKKNLRSFVFEVLPAAGFGQGCIYMYDPAARVLMPSIVIGDVGPERSQPVKLAGSVGHFDLVSSAFSLKTPLREEGVTSEGQAVTMIAAAIGGVTPIGVLYLESIEGFAPDLTDDPMPVFRALRHTLCDCLNLF